MPVPPRTGFNSTQLVRFLAGLQRAEVAASKQTFAERLSAWLDWTDAISLAGALSHEQALADSRPGTAQRARAVTAEYSRVRAELAQAVQTDAGFAAGVAGDETIEVSFLRSQYAVHQRAMAAAIAVLRAQVRAVLAEQSPALGRLAALDAVLDKALAARERHLLAGLPDRLEQQHGHTPSLQMQMQSALLAELDTRLQPVEGLMEALAEHAASAASLQATGKPTRQP